MFVFSVLLLLAAFKVDCADSNTTVAPVPTTLAPVPTTVAPVPTTVKPITTPAPPVPSIPKYNVVNSSGICLMLQMNLTITIRYYDTKNEKQYKDFYLNSTDQHANVTGACTPKYQLISLNWAPSEKSNKTFFTTLNFTLDVSNDQFSLTSIAFNYSLSDHDFPGTNETANYNVSHEVSKFDCPLGYYYRCMAEQTFELTGSESTITNPSVLYKVSGMKVEAFRNSLKNDFVGKERMCSADYVPNRIIPIVVGVILALLILIAILAFIIGSRRRRVGYQTI